MSQSHSSLSFAEQVDRFQTTIGAHSFRGLVLLGTLQANTSALLIAGLNPERVAFLLTDQSRANGMIDRCRNLLAEVSNRIHLRCAPDDWLCPEGDHVSILNVYTGLRRVLDRWKDLEHHEIAVDLTGGKSTMTVGLAKAAHVLRLESIYVDSVYDEHNCLIPGTQRLAIPEDPYLVFGDLEATEARRLHNHHDYAGAEKIFRDLARRVPDNQTYTVYADLAEAYAAWDNFESRRASTALDRVLAQDLPNDLQPARETLQAQRKALDLLTAINRHLIQHQQQSAGALAALRNTDQVLALLGSLHSTALRRADQERYDVAALIRYRCLELLSQCRLATYGIWTAEPSFDEALQRCPDLNARYRQVQRSQGFHRLYDLPERSIALFNGYMLLQSLDDPMVAGWDIGSIRNRSYVRNTSILAHGFRPILRQEYDEFADVVEEVIDRFFRLIGQSRREWERVHRFIPLPE